ncbi:MAG: hypothetical protein JWO35_887 [Candidatus Saccharibacteria bacterium]|nr:hypothetical protein [Candidatus Saccharibacteria bacterium]
MKIKKLDVRGFSHDILMVAFVVVFAIAGVGYIVASHADSCPPASGAVSSASGPVSGESCPASGPVSQVASAPSQLSAKCTITNVAAAPSMGATISPILTVANTGNQPFSPRVVVSFSILHANGRSNAVKHEGHTLAQIAPGKNGVIRLFNTQVGAAQSAGDKGVYTITTTTSPSFSCTASYIQPAKA